MKTPFFSAVLFISLLFAGQAKASVCTLVFVKNNQGQNLDFSPASGSDGEYAIYEKASLGKAKFLLKAGHGVTRLEGFISGKRVAVAWNHGEGALNLDLNVGGESVEGQCEDVSSVGN